MNDNGEPGIPTDAASALLEELQAVLAHEIPASKALGIRPLRYDGTQLALAAPLAPNLNHKQTAFGGSLYCAAVLAGWGLLHLFLRRRLERGHPHAHIVIQQADIDYRHPVNTDFEAVCRWPAHVDGERLLRMLARHGRARAELDVYIGPDSEPAVIFRGRYVIHTGTSPDLHAAP